MGHSTIMVWLSYDLGVQGDYEGLYQWLDNQDAKECGNSVAVFSYPYDASFPENLAENLQREVEIIKRSRIYIFYHDPESKKAKGKFLFGTRKAPPWSGYRSSEQDIADVES